jgi:hypothetical protein
MENKEKKSVNQIIRILHRNTGFFILGFVLIYALSGITLIYRDSDFMKKEKIVKLNLPVETKPGDLGPALKLREFKILRTEGDIIYFQGGSFNTATGEAQYLVKELVFPLNKFTSLHKTPSKNPFHWFTLVFGIILLFMAISSFWMFNTKSKIFRKGTYMVLAGFAFAVILLMFLK